MAAILGKAVFSLAITRLAWPRSMAARKASQSKPGAKVFSWVTL
jgi:hypothetical protein